MDPEIRQTTSGRCPRCGMQLVSIDASRGSLMDHDDRGLGAMTWRSYLPLIVIGLMILVASAVVASRNQSGIAGLITYFMTGFFLVFSGFKLMDLKGFAEGYSTYDLLASHFFAYGYVYPFIELIFGLLMLGGFHSQWLLLTEMGVMLFSGLGVALKLARHERFQCACLGTFLKVPLTYVTVVEDFGMALLALVLVFVI